MKRKTLNDVFPEWIENKGIFSFFDDLDVPWKEDVESSVLDLIYHGEMSGDKTISPLIRKLMTDGELSDESKTAIATAAVSIYANTWNREYAVLSAEYAPIENYNSIETMEDDITEIEYDHSVERTPDLTHVKSGSEVDEPDVINTTDGYVYGFNSTDPVPADQQITTPEGTLTHTFEDVTETESGTETSATSGKDTHTHNYTLTRKGNIGVTTSQQMLQSEIDLWRWNYFYDIVFPSLDKLLTIPIY